MLGEPKPCSRCVETDRPLILEVDGPGVEKGDMGVSEPAERLAAGLFSFGSIVGSQEYDIGRLREFTVRASDPRASCGVKQ